MLDDDTCITGAVNKSAVDTTCTDVSKYNTVVERCDGRLIRPH